MVLAVLDCFAAYPWNNITFFPVNNSLQDSHNPRNIPKISLNHQQVIEESLYSNWKFWKLDSSMVVSGSLNRW